MFTITDFVKKFKIQTYLFDGAHLLKCLLMDSLNHYQRTSIKPLSSYSEILRSIEANMSDILS